jgi:hypothetical protein
MTSEQIASTGNDERICQMNDEVKELFVFGSAPALTMENVPIVKEAQAYPADGSVAIQ